MKKHILIAYFSHSANTHRVAQYIRQETGGVLFEIQTDIPYPNSYDQVVAQAKREIESGYRPVLKTGQAGLAPYDTLFIGSPNWWNTVAPPVAAFLEAQDLSGRTVAPFCTHGGGGAGRIWRDVKDLCDGATVLDGLALYGDGGEGGPAAVQDWLRRLGLKSG